MTESKSESSKKTQTKKAEIVGEQKLASGERLVSTSAGSGLAVGPSQDDLNPAYAPPKEDAENADAKS